MNATRQTAIEVCKVLDTLTALAVDLACHCDALADTLVLSAHQARAA